MIWRGERSRKKAFDSRERLRDRLFRVVIYMCVNATQIVYVNNNRDYRPTFGFSHDLMDETRRLLSFFFFLFVLEEYL